MSSENNQITCVIVEDEPLAQNIYHRYLGKLPDIDLIATCNNAVEAISVIQTKKPGFILLDINMRGGNGSQHVMLTTKEENDSAFVKFDKKNMRLSFKNIWMIQAMEDSLKILLKEPINAMGYIVIRMTMKEIEAKLPEEAFLTISRSYIVNFQEVIAWKL